jgi:hypothetical protein
MSFKLPSLPFYGNAPLIMLTNSLNSKSGVGISASLFHAKFDESTQGYFLARAFNFIGTRTHLVV